MQDLPIPTQPLPPDGVEAVLVAAGAAYPLISLLSVIGLVAFLSWLCYRLLIKKLEASLLKSPDTRDIFLKVKKLEHDTERMKLKKSVTKD
ncbi:hypothetical protein [Lysobacter brunescens]|uniref:Uncharacterized protein n=1 Tax=Lysobacter brunescens TaxID=262323 RepID=A0ABW2YEM6_9GAMM